jgi:hypothetical protein
MATPTALKGQSQMAPPTGTPGGSSSPAAPSVPFLWGTYEHSEINSGTPVAVQPGTTAKPLSFTITAGGFLRGVMITFTSSGGVAGTAFMAAADAPWSLITSATLQLTSGKQMLGPMSGWQLYMNALFMRPWDLDPAQLPTFSNGVNPSFQIRMFNEIRASVGVLPNLDSRAKYQLKLVIAPKTKWYSVAPTTVPTLSISVWKTDYAQPDPVNILGQQVTQTPPGIAWQRNVSTQELVTVAGTKWYTLTTLGQYIRCLLLEVRNATGARTAIAATKVATWQLDNAQRWVQTIKKWKYENERYFGAMWANNGGNAVAAKALPTGMYALPQFHNPGDRDGPVWLPTAPGETFRFQLTGLPAGGTLSFTMETLAPTTVGTPGHQFGL